jgi:hypothetical protein
MKKYYYYTYRSKSMNINCGSCSIEDGCFDVNRMMRKLYKESKCICIITFWKEISEKEFEGLMEFFDEVNNSHE